MNAMKTSSVRFTKRKRPVPAPEKSRSVNPARDFERRWLNNDLVQELDTLLDSASKIDCAEFIHKISDLHQKRDVRYLKGNYSIEDVSDLALQETATRSSIVGIAAKSKWYITKMEALRKAIKVRATTSDYEWLSNNVKTQTDRSLMVESLLIDADIVMADLQALHDFAETIVGDIDKAGYTIKTLMQGFELDFKTERTYNGR